MSVEVTSRDRAEISTLRTESRRGGAIRTVFVTSFSDLERIAPDWDRLWRSDRKSTIFGSLPWARAWWRAFGGQRKLCAAVVREGEQIAGILPLCVEKTTLRFLGDPRSDYCDMLCDPEADADTVVSVFRELGTTPVSWNRCILRHLPGDSNILAALPRIERETGWFTRLEVESVCMSVDLSVQRAQTLKEITGKKHLRRRENALNRVGRLSFRHLESREEAKAHLSNLFRQHIARRAMVGEKSLYFDSDCRLFFEALVEELDPACELRFSVVELDDKPLCYHFGFEAGGVFVAYKPTFNVDYWHYSTGDVLFKRLFEYVENRPVRKFDFTVGDEEYKRRFANSTATNYTLYLFRPCPGGLAGSLGVRAVHAIKRRPALLNRLNAATAALDNLVQTGRSIVKRRGFRGLMEQIGAAAWRGWIFRRETLRVFAVEESGRRAAEDGLEVKEAQLSDLAGLADVHPGFLSPAKLGLARNRLRQGDKAHTVWKAGQLAMVIWSGTRTEISTSGVNDSFRIDLEGPALVLYDQWVPAAMHGESLCPSELPVGGERDEDATVPRRVYYVDESSSVLIAEGAGCRLQYRVRRNRLFHSIRLGKGRLERIFA